MNLRKLLLLPFLVTLIIVSNCKKEDELQNGFVRGYVINTKNEPLANVKVSIPTTVNEVFSDSTGYYIITDLEPKAYTIKAELEGYIANTKSASVIGGDSIDCPFILESKNPEIIITAPSSTDIWVTSTQNNQIKWTTNVGGNVKIDLFKGTAFLQTIETSTLNDETYIWTIPASLQAGNNYKIKITSLIYTSALGESDYFTISNTFISIYPTQIAIPCNSSTINLSITSNTNWNLITNCSWCLISGSSSGSGNSQVNVSILENETEYERTSEITLSSSGISPCNLKITQSSPSIAIISPFLNDNLQMGTNCNVTWSSQCIDDIVKIDLYKDGIFIRNIFTTTANDGIEVWNIETNIVEGNNYQIKISTVNFNYSDLSESFSISKYSIPLVDIEGNIYQTVQIGSQIWMKENLKTKHYYNSVPLINGTYIYNSYNDYSTKYWFVYNNESLNKDIYGLLYSWAAAMNGASSSDLNPSGIQGICPSGWHIPSATEFFILCSGCGSDFYFNSLKESGYDHWAPPNTGATDQFEFTALPGGCRNDTMFMGLNYRGFWWSTSDNSTVNCTDIPDKMRLESQTPPSGYDFNCYFKNYGMSVRCIKD